MCGKDGKVENSQKKLLEANFLAKVQKLSTVFIVSAFVDRK